jgi:hypothetical protein
MDIDSLDTNDLMHLIEGYFCWPTDNEETAYLQNTLAALMEWHETTDEELMAGLSHYRDDIGPRVNPVGYDSAFRKEHLFE